MQKQSFMRGTMILTVSAFITRILGFINGILLVRFLGAEGVGLLMMAHPLVPLVITLTELGLPVAISKLVSEADAQGDSHKVKRILVVSLTVTMSLSVVLTGIAFFGAQWVASIFLTDQRAYYAMLAITPIAPIIAVSAVLKGYFRGKQHMKPLAFSEVIENLIQIIFIIALVQLLLPYGIEYAAAGAMVSSVIGEGAGLIYIFSMYKIYARDKAERLRVSEQLRHGGRTLRELLQIGLPTTGNGFIHSVYRAFLPMLVTKSLILSGVGTIMATKQYGLLAGYTFPLLFLPGFFTQSLSTALIPAISEAMARGDGKLMHERMDQSMRIALFVGAPATAILYVWAVPLTSLMYHAPEAGQLVKILAPVFFLYYFEIPLHAILLGLGRAATAMWNYLIANVFEAAAIFIFGSHLGIQGVAVGLGFGICLLTLLNFMSVAGTIGCHFDVRQWLKVSVSSAAMVICGSSAFAFMRNSGFSLLWAILAAFAVALPVYLMALLVTGALKRSELRQLSSFKQILIRTDK